jgi:transposase
VAADAEGSVERRLRELEGRVREVEADNQRLRVENDRLRAENTKLRGLLEEARRAGKRQAAPFSKGPPKEEPKPPGRKAGDEYGCHARRRPPRHVDLVLDAPLPAACPHCRGALRETAIEQQWQTEIPKIVPTVVQFDVHIGECRSCHRRVQGRHQRQTSDALGAAASQIGPTALAIAVELNKAQGMPFGRVQRFFENAFGLTLSKATLVRAVERIGKKAEPLYGNIAFQIRKSLVSTWDETGWRIGGRSAWLWVAATARFVLYLIRRNRRHEVAMEVLRSDYGGTVVADGYVAYNYYSKATRQLCLAHLLRRCKELLEVARAPDAGFPRAIRAWILHALALRNRRDHGEISEHGLLVAIGRLATQRDRLLARWNRCEENRTFAKHLRHHRNDLLTFLYLPEVDATNWRGEQALRGAVITRKISAGNRTARGAHAQEVLASVLRTAVAQKIDPVSLIVRVLRLRDPIRVSRLAFNTA